MAATPSPRPVRPRPSVVVALTLMGASAAAVRVASASARRGLKRGLLPMIWMLTLPMVNPVTRTRRAASARRVQPEAPAHWGSPVPKWVPRSPIPAALNRASQAEWAATSASEWPWRPVTPGQCRPASHMGRSGSGEKAWTSVPMPTRGIIGYTG